MYRNKEIKVRLTEKELTKLNKKAERTNMFREEYIRRLISGYEPQETPPPRFFELLRKLWDIQHELSVRQNEEIMAISKALAEICNELQSLGFPQKVKICILTL